jgi:hypothetical protein
MPYVSVKLSSGIGNRLFQVAAMLGYADRHGHTPVFVRPWIAANDSHPGPKTILDFFPEIPVLEQELDGCTALVSTDNDAFTYIELPHVEGNVCLEGCFQSERYFPRTRLQPRLLQYAHMPALLGDTPLGDTPLAFMHVRRGDYLGPYTAHHRVDLTDYFRRALSTVGTHVRILVCSDDIAWCRAELPRQYSDIVSYDRWIWMPNEVSDYVTLAAMSRCDAGAICANSTFSWWGAYFGSREYVTMPAKWGHPPLPPARDLYPSWAILLPV